MMQSCQHGLESKKNNNNNKRKWFSNSVPNKVLSECCPLLLTIISFDNIKSKPRNSKTKQMDQQKDRNK